MANNRNTGGCLGTVLTWAIFIALIAIAAYLLNTHGFEGTLNLIKDEWAPALWNFLVKIGQWLITIGKN